MVGAVSILHESASPERAVWKPHLHRVKYLNSNHIKCLNSRGSTRPLNEDHLSLSIGVTIHLGLGDWHLLYKASRK